MLSIKNLSVSLDGKRLLTDVSMNVDAGARHLLRGSNGSGKTTLVQTIAGNPEYTRESGDIIFNGTNITNENTTTRALMGIFIGAQNVPEIPGLSVMSFLKHSLSAHTHFQTGKLLSSGLFFEKLKIARERLDIPESWLARSINVGFSGGERKRLMFLQLLMTWPKLAILDEPDSGVDAATQKLFADVIMEMNAGTPHMEPVTFIFISHQDKFTDMINPTQITTLNDGVVVV